MPDAALPPAAFELELELEPQASSTIAAIPAAPPVSAVRRVNCRLTDRVRRHRDLLVVADIWATQHVRGSRKAGRNEYRLADYSTLMSLVKR